MSDPNSYTNEEKSAAWKWLKQLALSDGAPRHAVVAITAWTALAEAACNGPEGEAWQALPALHDGAPFDGKPVLIATNHTWGSKVHRAIWTDAIHGHGIFGWAVEDMKHGPYALRGYTQVSHWMPLPDAPSATSRHSEEA